MKKLKPNEVTENGFYWAKRNAHPDEVVEVYFLPNFKAKVVARTSSEDAWWPNDFNEFYGPIPNPWKEEK